MASWTRRAVACAHAYELDVDRMLRHAALDPAALDDPTGRVAYDRHFEAVVHMAERLDDPGIGVTMGAGSSVGDFGVVSLLGEACATLRDALEVVQRFNVVANQASLMDYWIDRGRLFILDGHLRDGRPAPPVLAEATLAFWAKMLRNACALERPFDEIWFAHERHRAWTPERVAHFDATLRFRRPFNALVLPPVALIGHSWGGAYATYFVQRFPHRVRTLVLAEPGALDRVAAAEVNVAAVDFGSAELHELLNTTDYLVPDGDARADYFYVIALAAFKAEERLLGYAAWRLGYRANIGINTWQGNFDGSFTFDFTTGLEAFTGQTLFITGRRDGRLGHTFQSELQIPHFPGAEVLHLPDAEHAELLRRPEALAAIRASLGGVP